MRILVTGSRAFSDASLVRSVLDGLLAEYGSLTVVHGACPTGADAVANLWARRRRREGLAVEVEPYPARDFGTWPSCGPRRNAHMVNLGADLLVAFFEPGAPNKGTAHCAELAERAHIPIHRYPEETHVGP